MVAVLADQVFQRLPQPTKNMVAGALFREEMRGKGFKGWGRRLTQFFKKLSPLSLPSPLRAVYKVGQHTSLCNRGQSL